MEVKIKMNNKYLIPTIALGTALLGGCSASVNKVDLANKRLATIENYGPMYSSGNKSSIILDETLSGEELEVAKKNYNSQLDFLVKMGKDDGSMFYNLLSTPLIAAETSKNCEGGLETELCKDELRGVAAKKLAPLFLSENPMVQNQTQHAIVDYKKQLHDSWQQGYATENMYKQITFNAIVIALATYAANSAANNVFDNSKTCTSIGAGSGQGGSAVGGNSTGGSTGPVGNLINYISHCN